jgi:hypothetical protein
MKNIKSITAATVIMGIISLHSCKKDVELQVPTTVVPGSATTFKEIKVNPSFNWKSARVVTLKIEASITPIKISNTLVVKAESGEVIFKKLQNMNEAYIGYITLPNSMKKVNVSFGSISKTVDIVENTIDFNYVSESIPVE